MEKIVANRASGTTITMFPSTIIHTNNNTPSYYYLIAAYVVKVIQIISCF